MDNMESITQHFIGLIQPLVKGRAIFIADQDAIITASSDPGLIGRRHEAARQAILSSQIVRVSRHDLPRYPGAGEGITLPVNAGGGWRGAVGICGAPAEVEEQGNLLRLCLTQYLEQSALGGSQLYREYRLRLLRLLIYGQFSEQEVERLCTLLGIQLQFPMRVLVLSPDGRRAAKDESLAALLIDQGFINPQRDIYGVEQEQFVLLRYAPPKEEPTIARQLYELLREHFFTEPVVARGERCERAAQLCDSYREALWLSVSSRGYQDMSSKPVEARYLMGQVESGAAERFIGPMYRAVRAQFTGEFEDIITTIELYCTGEGLVSTAQQLHIHKNTLIYRIKKVCAVAGIEGESAFVKEFFLRMIVQYHRQRAIQS